MNGPEVRWQQRLQNYLLALAQLRAAVTLSRQRELSELEQQGMIQAFEFTHELAWNVMKDYFVFQGSTQITGSRDATRQAFSVGFVEDGETWMEMIQSRIQSSHTYNRATALSLVQRITERYAELFDRFAVRMQGLRSD